MITIKEAEEILKKEYHIDNYEYLIGEILLPDYSRDKHEIDFKNELFSSVTMLGESKICDVTVFEVNINEGYQNRRVGITQAMFRILRNLHINNALVSFVNADKNNYRISLLTSKYEFDGNKIIKVLSNPRRFSYSLGYGTKTKTAYDFLIAKGKVNSLDELINRFSVEVVNKKFYTEIATAFTELVGGERNGNTYEKQLSLYGVVEHNKYAEFGVRLIGRILFCWFLREKRSENNIPLVPDDMLDIDTVNNSNSYYHNILEPLFFELLNTNQNRRKSEFKTDYYNKIPYLNGGLFSPHSDDMYKYDSNMQSGAYGLVTIPNEWFYRLYSIFNEYNFTVDENTAYDIELSIDPEMLGRIFENLLAEINPETGENAKKSTGSFYTPRDIVDYMVDSSLCEYLKNKTAIPEEKLKALISYSKEDDELAVFSNTEKKDLIDALYTVTVLDPACGSGAFPIGMLQKIVYMLQELDPDANLWFDKATENVGIFIKKEFEKKFNAGSLNYIRKLSVIQNSIFGVDIQPIAVEISRLRCFLSLIIEEKVHDSEENRGINPLPNLDFKFIIANSLIKLADPVQVQLSLFESQADIDRLKAIREEYFNADNDRRNELKIEFSGVQQDMLLTTIENFAKSSSERYNQLSSWKPFANVATEWFDIDWMFGVKDGFDIVIANPPYIQLQTMHKQADRLQQMEFKTFARTGDIYCLFYELGIELLKPNGILTFITSNKWMRAGYGKALREYLYKNSNPIFLIDFAGQKIFESATVDVNILQCSKEKYNLKTQSCLAKGNCLNNLSVFIEQNAFDCDFSTSESWTILNPIEQSIKKKIDDSGVPLKNWGINIYRGILTGCNDAFIISENTKNELLEKDPNSAEIIRPILRGRDIKRYGYDFADLWLICTHNGLKQNNIPPVNINNYPAIKKHLDKYYDKLLKRQDKGDTPYNLRNCVYLDDFSKQKIVWKRIGSKLRFCLDNESCMTLDSTCFATGKNIEYIVAILNSYLGNYLFRDSPKTGTGDLIVSVQAFEPIKIPLPNKEQEFKIVSLMYKIISLSDAENSEIEKYENELNEIVYQLYEISPQEQKYIENMVISEFR